MPPTKAPPTDDSGMDLKKLRDKNSRKESSHRPSSSSQSSSKGKSSHQDTASKSLSGKEKSKYPKSQHRSQSQSREFSRLGSKNPLELSIRDKSSASRSGRKQCPVPSVPLYLSSRDKISTPGTEIEQASVPLELSRRDKTSTPRTESGSSSGAPLDLSRRDKSSTRSESKSWYQSKHSDSHSRKETPAQGGISRYPSSPSQDSQSNYPVYTKHDSGLSKPSHVSGKQGSRYTSESGESKSKVQSGFENLKSRPPVGTKTILMTKRDEEMARRQTKYTSLAPFEKKEQEEWAQEQIQRTGKCPQSFAWTRRDQEAGYQCEGGNHFISDELLAEGKGGVIFLPLDLTGKWGCKYGPYYQDPNDSTRYVYGGPLKNGKHPRNVPLAITTRGIMQMGEYDVDDPVITEMQRRALERTQNALFNALSQGNQQDATQQTLKLVQKSLSNLKNSKGKESNWI